MDESKVHEQVESRKLVVEATANWHTPAGNRRSAPIYEAEDENEYLNKRRTIKANTTDELESKAREVVNAWAEQEIRKRIVDGKRDVKEQGQAEAQRLDTEAKQIIAEAKELLATTLAVDDRLDWDAERDTREFKAFSFPDPPPQRPISRELVLPLKPRSWVVTARSPSTVGGRVREGGKPSPRRGSDDPGRLAGGRTSIRKDPRRSPTTIREQQGEVPQ